MYSIPVVSPLINRVFRVFVVYSESKVIQLISPKVFSGRMNS